ncbi:NADP-dependent 3-hydroxy acid dehydrogenase YdfG [Mycobacterium numidiamassiliense]|jgi:NAD(P)-dependent dehydrogenase (short-subunit alcohol dehydrogenase family)|uniref:NADP-dependent 3-hydroxy acid dehydrogenase YdfG n=1 Tax=Mycobacterium numidiamassiliense TaxID=1841861 RepID=A0A2U3PHI1_9MYCO|nr:SDR family oxidoreductase [Mycobacterium numidiamassiliense]SPM43224.1 NADP-dependent 3-hydroxy acid dehydrogenase YdfG [Mycobacterium numidiamassiliense]
MEIKDSVVLVTGANRGIGAEWVHQLRERGAAKIYAGARDPRSVVCPDDRVMPIALDVTARGQVLAAAELANDVQIVVNNAAVSYRQPLIGGDVDRIHAEFETNVFGLVYVTEAFAPVLRANGGGAIVNALSAVSWFSFPGMAGYSATKSAAWNLTDALRLELADQGTLVVALHSGAVTTPMGDNFPIDKIEPTQVVSAALDGLQAGQTEVLADDISRVIKSTLTSDPSRYAAILGG